MTRFAASLLPAEFQQDFSGFYEENGIEQLAEELMWQVLYEI